MDAPLPIVPGTTQTAEDTEPMMSRLQRELARKPGGEFEALNAGIESLQDAYLATDNPDVQERIAQAIALLQFGDASKDNEEVDDEMEDEGAPPTNEPINKPAHPAKLA